jgi:hypothetical protein
MPETDFSKGVRGKHYKKYQASVITVRIDGGVAQRVTKAPRRVSKPKTKKTPTTKGKPRPEPIVEYDFSKGVRGKYVERYRAARVTVQLDPDVAQEFPDSASANEGLRTLLRLKRGESTI